MTSMQKTLNFPLNQAFWYLNLEDEKQSTHRRFSRSRGTEVLCVARGWLQEHVDVPLSCLQRSSHVRRGKKIEAPRFADVGMAKVALLTMAGFVAHAGIFENLSSCGFHGEPRLVGGQVTAFKWFPTSGSHDFPSRINKARTKILAGSKPGRLTGLTN
ncbi:hypothetical protein CPB83DRAFT_36102 [Crepidotus variabilis]|uniref:Uncharacterized protein n=1 Tax=Crepidotus variabilis TaxID=179855 RepID=A0A9P6JWZ9_9AGAR|nr:hypothetical protein CPB83DRAFT_36102 [Crepidotus variabilis]